MRRAPRVVAITLLLGSFAVLGARGTALTAAAATPSCAPDLYATLGPGVATATMEEAFTIVLDNTSAHTCSTNGYPGVRMVNVKNKTLSFTISHKATGAYPFNGAAPVAQTVKSHHKLYGLIAKLACVGKNGPAVARTVITAPGSGKARSTTLGVTGLWLCAGKGKTVATENTLAVSALQPTYADLFPKPKVSTTPCTNEFTAAIGPYPPAVAKTDQLSLALTFTGTNHCTLTGYPTAAFETTSKKSVPFTYVHSATGSYPWSKAKPPKLSISHKGKLYVLFAKLACSTKDATVADYVTVRLPPAKGQVTKGKGAPVTYTVKLKSKVEVFATCAGKAPHKENEVAVSALEPSLLAGL